MDETGPVVGVEGAIALKWEDEGTPLSEPRNEQQEIKEE